VTVDWQDTSRLAICSHRRNIKNIVNASRIIIIICIWERRNDNILNINYLCDSKHELTVWNFFLKTIYVKKSCAFNILITGNVISCKCLSAWNAEIIRWLYFLCYGSLAQCNTVTIFENNYLVYDGLLL